MTTYEGDVYAFSQFCATTPWRSTVDPRRNGALFYCEFRPPSDAVVVATDSCRITSTDSAAPLRFRRGAVRRVRGRSRSARAKPAAIVVDAIKVLRAGLAITMKLLARESPIPTISMQRVSGEPPPSLTLPTARGKPEAAMLADIDQVNGFLLLRRFLDRATHTPVMPDGRPFRVEMTNAGEWGWLSDRSGYRYARCHPATGAPWPSPPPALGTAVARAVAAALGERAATAFHPQCYLINRYSPGRGRLGLHRDLDERDRAQPIVTLSLGAAAVFLAGGAARRDRVERVALESGDVRFAGSIRTSFSQGSGHLVRASPVSPYASVTFRWGPVFAVVARRAPSYIDPARHRGFRVRTIPRGLGAVPPGAAEPCCKKRWPWQRLLVSISGRRIRASP